MLFLYPSDPFEKHLPDEVYAEEYEAALDAGLKCALFSFEDAQEDKFRPKPALEPGEAVVYRGWMLTVPEYIRLYKQTLDKGATLFVTPRQYEFAHYLVEWYPRCTEFTPKTLLFANDNDIDAELEATGWEGYFVKDFVKSLTTSRGSVARTIDEVHDIVKMLIQYRGKLEGGLCIRQYEDLITETEERYFVWKGKPYAREGVVPDLVGEVAKRIDSPFFTVDVAMRNDGVLRLIEVGDGQVSDRKQWTIEQLVSIFKN